MSKTVLEVLEGAQRRVTDRWAQGSMAQDGFGHVCGANDPGAVVWCAAGALRAEVGIDDLWDQNEQALELLALAEQELAEVIAPNLHSDEVGYGYVDAIESFELTITGWNDTDATHLGVCEAFQAAIRRRKGETGEGTIGVPDRLDARTNDPTGSEEGCLLGHGLWEGDTSEATREDGARELVAVGGRSSN